MENTDDFTPERWGIPSDLTLPVRPREPIAPRTGRSGKFLKGPVSWEWIRRAMRLPGKALAVGMMLWLEHGMTGRWTVHFCLARAAAEGIPTTTARRAIRVLERAGLVTILRKPGCGLEVTILTDSTIG
jgi:hypothetical protein